MHFVGVDLAWGQVNQSGIAVLDADGCLVHLGTGNDDDSIATAVEPYVRGDCLVAIDAPLIVKNPTGRRRAEADLSADFGRFDAGAYPANTSNPAFASTPRGAKLAAAVGLDMNPASPSRTRAIEVYPHPATVVLFELGRTLKYKRGAVAERRSELLRLMELIEGLAPAVPQLHVTGSQAWISLRNAVAAATKPAQVSRSEDPVDAVLCAYTALFFHTRPRDVTIYGNFDSGYIVTPTLPPHRSSAP